MKEKFTIGKLAHEAGVNVETVRFYERKGLIQQPVSGTGFRTYPKSAAQRIRFIKRGQELGFSLKEIEDILALQLRDEAKCSDMLLKTEAKISEIEKKIKDLERMKDSLSQFAQCCEDKDIPLSECPVLECFIELGGCCS